MLHKIQIFFLGKLNKKIAPHLPGSPGPYLLALNTGELYPMVMDTPQPEGTLSLWGGVDELSQSTLQIISDFHLPYNTAHLRQTYTTLSLHRLKNTYCDSCIDKILAAVADIDGDNLVPFLLFTAADTAFYPINPAAALPLPGIEVLPDSAPGQLKLNYYRNPPQRPSLVICFFSENQL